MVKIEDLNNIGKNDMDNILHVWESSVRATHNFLSEDDITSIKPQVIEGVNHVSKLLCIRNKKGTIRAFIGVHDDKIEMLFVSNDSRGKGIGKNLSLYCI